MLTTRSPIQAVQIQVKSSQGRLPVAASLVTHFGPDVDVRHRGVLRMPRHHMGDIPDTPAPAVVRLWQEVAFREFDAAQARALAAQLLAAAALAERQNLD